MGFIQKKRGGSVLFLKGLCFARVWELPLWLLQSWLLWLKTLWTGAAAARAAGQSGGGQRAGAAAREVPSLQGCALGQDGPGNISMEDRADRDNG